MERAESYLTTSSNTPLYDKSGGVHADHEPRSIRFAKGLGAVALYTAIYGTSVTVADISQGIQAGKERVAYDHAQLHTIYEYKAQHPSFDSHATIVLTGLGTKDASETARSLTAHSEIGSVYAVEYGNRDLDTQDIAERIIEQSNKDGITHVSFDGYSMGGPIALDIATHIHSSKNDLEVVSIILNSSPVGEGSLTEQSRQSIEALERVLSLHKDLVYYKNGRIFIELVARSEHYLRAVGQDGSSDFQLHNLNEYSVAGVRYHVDYEALRHELTQVKAKMNDPKVADANLINNQAQILKLNFAQKIREISQNTLVVYTRSASASGDTIVDVEASENNVVQVLSDYDHPHKILRARVQHANPTERRNEYDRLIRYEIQPDIILYLQAHGSTKTATDPVE